MVIEVGAFIVDSTTAVLVMGVMGDLLALAGSLAL